MSLIYGYIKTILYIFIFITFVMIIVPNEKFKKYISFVLGVLLILVIIGPLTKLSEIKPSDLSGIFDFSAQTSLPDYQKTQRDMLSQTLNYNTKMQLKSVIDNYASMVFDSYSMDLSDDLSRVLSVNIKVTKSALSDGNFNKEVIDAKNKIAQIYKIDVSIVHINTP